MPGVEHAQIVGCANGDVTVKHGAYTTVFCSMSIEERSTRRKLDIEKTHYTRTNLLFPFFLSLNQKAGLTYPIGTTQTEFRLQLALQ